MRQDIDRVRLIQNFPKIVCEDVCVYMYIFSNVGIPSVGLPKRPVNKYSTNTPTAKKKQKSRHLKEEKHVLT